MYIIESTCSPGVLFINILFPPPQANLFLLIFDSCLVGWLISYAWERNGSMPVALFFRSHELHLYNCLERNQVVRCQAVAMATIVMYFFACLFGVDCTWYMRVNYHQGYPQMHSYSSSPLHPKIYCRLSRYKIYSNPRNIKEVYFSCI